jgi:hypothetical protein
MYYTINVALHGQHFFRTGDTSCINMRDAARVYDALAARFLAEEGFELMLTRMEVTGREIAREALGV